MKVEIPDELVKTINEIILSDKFGWLQCDNVQNFVVDAVKRRTDELIWGPAYERQRS